MRIGRRPLVFALALVACVGCDHASKRVAESLLAGSPGVSLVGGAVRLELTFNQGAFLSLGAGLPESLRSLVLLGLVPLFIAWLCLFFARTARGSNVQLVALGLLAGGGLANWLERLLNDGFVTDFVSLGVGRLRTGIFNLADVAVLAGAAALLLLQRHAWPPPPRAT